MQFLAVLCTVNRCVVMYFHDPIFACVFFVREHLTNAPMNMEKRTGSDVILFSSTYWQVTSEVWSFMRLEQRTGERMSRREF